MSDSTTGDERPSDVPQVARGSDPIERVEGYPTADGIVLYDSLNPFAWVQSTVSSELRERR